MSVRQLRNSARFTPVSRVFHAPTPPLTARLDPMRFATWNVNSIRTRVDRVIAFLERSGTDVLAMQENKCRPDQFHT